MSRDIGHKNLMNDITNLLNEVIDYQFHDTKNTNYAAPKVTLVQKLLDLANQVKEGRYDN